MPTVTGMEPGGAGPPAGGAATPPPPPPPNTDRERQVNRVVVALLDGRRLRGFVYDVNTQRGDFHLYMSEDPGETNAELVKLKACKGVFFVKSLTGNPNYRENKTDLPERRRWGRGVEVVFSDGERMVGTAEIFHPGRVGFYLIPPDPRSNNLRIFVVFANARSVRLLGDATGTGVAGTWEPPDPVTYPSDKRIEVVLRLLRDPDVEKLSNEVYLPVAIMDFWKRRFTNAALDALSDQALAVPRPGEETERPRDKPDRSPPEKRLDVVLRLFAKEDKAVVSQVFLVPFRVLLEWRERALDAGRAALRALAEEEDGTPSEIVQARYEALLAASDPRVQRDNFLDSLSESMKDPPGGRT